MPGLIDAVIRGQIDFSAQSARHYTRDTIKVIGNKLFVGLRLKFLEIGSLLIGISFLV